VADESQQPPRSLTSAAIVGSFANSAQWIANKAAVAVSTLVVARYVTPDEYGLAAQAFSIATAVLVLSPGPMADVLIAHPRSLGLLAPAAWRLAAIVAVSMATVTLAAIPVAVACFTNYPAAWLAWLLTALAVRPIFDALLVVPLSSLRVDLRFRRLAMTDGVCQLGATGATILLAVSGAGAAAIVLPQVAVSVARFLAYSPRVRGQGSAKATRAAGALRGYLVRAFVPAALAQYVHNVLVVLEILVLGLVSGDVQTGLFGFGFTVAAQANALIAYQLGQVLQPIFGKLQDDRVRQVSGLIRAQRVLAAVCVPIALLQAAVAEPTFRLLFPKWMDAVPVFQAISLGQAFYFATGPSMACLRAQKRFSVLFAWQACQLALSAPVFWAAARWQGALGVAIVSGAMWSVSSPVALLLCKSGIPSFRSSEMLLLFARPWSIGVPVMAVTWFFASMSKSLGPIADAAAVLGLAPLALFVTLWATKRFDPVFGEAADRLAVSFKTRIRGVLGRKAVLPTHGCKDN
jgi:O-antigen/teichoic acid export membrane protein